jgi:Transposase domain (DUF772)
MMGRLNHDQGQLFYSFSLEEAVPADHLVREIAAVLDLAWVRAELAPYYSSTGRPSIDPELMIRMLIIGYVFAIRSERALCRDVQAPEMKMIGMDDVAAMAARVEVTPPPVATITVTLRQTKSAASGES